VRAGSQTPRVSSWPAYATSAGQDAIDLCASVGLHLDPWQQYVLTHGLGERPDGKWAARRVSCWVPRQNGKGGIILARELAGLLLFGERLILHSAHEYKTAQEGFLRLKELLDGSDDLRRRVKAIREANGEQGIEMRSGQRLRFVARSRGSSRGFTADLLILDEAQEITVEQVAAMAPTQAAVPNPQAWFFGTPPSDPSAWAYTLREAGERGDDGLAHFDWGADLDLDDPEDVARLDDRDLWRACNPALGIRIDESFLADQRTTLGPAFAHEHLGVWLPRAAAGSGVIPTDLWRELAVPAQRPADVAFAIHVNLTRTYAAISYAGRLEDGSMLVGLADWRPGTAWVVERAAELKQRWNPVAIAVDTRSESLLHDLEKAGIVPPEDPDRPKRGDLAVPTATEAAAAFGMFIDAVRAKSLRHLDEGPLNVAVAGAKTRLLAGGSTWDHKSPVEIGPVAAATLAHWAYLTRVDLVNDDYDVLASVL